jgi:hypothetical protein
MSFCLRAYIRKRIAGSMSFLAILCGPAQPRDMIHETALVEQAPAGKTFDYIVHVRNVPAVGYNPVVKEDRARMALLALSGQCREGRIVGDDKVTTEIWGITSSYADYLILVKCRKILQDFR